MNPDQTALLLLIREQLDMKAAKVQYQMTARRQISF